VRPIEADLLAVVGQGVLRKWIPAVIDHALWGVLSDG
jgi:hypothetical protein